MHEAGEPAGGRAFLACLSFKQKGKRQLLLFVYKVKIGRTWGWEEEHRHLPVVATKYVDGILIGHHCVFAPAAKKQSGMWEGREGIAGEAGVHGGRGGEATQGMGQCHSWTATFIRWQRPLNPPLPNDSACTQAMSDAAGGGSNAGAIHPPDSSWGPSPSLSSLRSAALAPGTALWGSTALHPATQRPGRHHLHSKFPTPWPRP